MSQQFDPIKSFTDAIGYTGYVLQTELNGLIYGAKVSNATIDVARTIGVNAAVGAATKPVTDAWKATIKWGEDVQQNISWFAQGAGGFLNTAGNFVNALSGQAGLLGSIGAIMPFLVIGLIAFAVIRK